MRGNFVKPSVAASIVVALIILIGAGAFVLSKEKSSDTQNSASEHENTAEHNALPGHDENGNHIDEASSSDQAGPITKEQVALHNTEDDCWTIINGSVYDISSYIPRHPGGDNILSACGTDGTEFFNGNKEGQAGGTNEHGGAAKTELAKLLLGELSQ